MLMIMIMWLVINIGDSAYSSYEKMVIFDKISYKYWRLFDNIGSIPRKSPMSTGDNNNNNNNNHGMITTHRRETSARAQSRAIKSRVHFLSFSKTKKISTQKTEKRNIVSLELVVGVTYPRENENSENENSVRFMDV
jgi:hypothetical protein